MDKGSLRKLLLNQLAQISSDDLQALSFSLTRQLVKFFQVLPGLTGQVGAGYLPLKTEIAPMYQELLRHVPLSLAFPVLRGEEMVMGLPEGPVHGQTAWLASPHKLVEPKWVLVPGVGFDLKGARLGRGKGYYDRYLKGLDSIKVGLAWSGQMRDSVPVESHDCHMDYIITENSCWDVKRQKTF